jgi:hypothetical protein
VLEPVILAIAKSHEPTADQRDKAIAELRAGPLGTVYDLDLLAPWTRPGYAGMTLYTVMQPHTKGVVVLVAQASATEDKAFYMRPTALPDVTALGNLHGSLIDVARTDTPGNRIDPYAGDAGSGSGVIGYRPAGL